MNNQLQNLAYLLPGKMPLVLIEEGGAEVPEPDSMLSRKETVLAFEIEPRFIDFLSFYTVSFGELSNAVQGNPLPDLSNFFVTI